MDTGPPGMGTLRKSAEIAGLAGMCWTHGSRSARRKNAEQASNIAAREIRLPDFKRYLLSPDVVRDILGGNVNGVLAGGKVGWHGQLP